MMPALSLGIVSSALLLRIMRTGDARGAVVRLRPHRARQGGGPGASSSAAMRCKNALIPYLTVGAVEFGFLFGGVVIIEDIFLLPGIGSLVLVGIINRDYPVLLAAALVVTVVVLTVNMLVDLAAALLDPRQVQGEGGAREHASRGRPAACGAASGASAC